MMLVHRFLPCTRRVQQHFARFARCEFSSAENDSLGAVCDSGEDFESDVDDVTETRSPPPRGLAAMRLNEGGNINRADLLGTITELKLLDRLSKPEQQWATMFLRTNIPVISNARSDSDCVEYRSCTYHNRVHVFDRRLLPMVKRMRPGDRVFVTGFISYYKPTLTSSPPELAKVRKIGAVVAERLVLLGNSAAVEGQEDAAAEVTVAQGHESES